MSLHYYPQGYRYRSAARMSGAVVGGEQGSDSDVAELSDLEDDGDEDEEEEEEEEEKKNYRNNCAFARKWEIRRSEKRMTERKREREKTVENTEIASNGMKGTEINWRGDRVCLRLPHRLVRATNFAVR